MAKQTLHFSTVMLMVAGVSLLVGTLTLPGSDLSAIFRSQANNGYSLEELQADRADWREQRRLYSRAIERCRDLRQQGQTLDCLSIKINDPATFQPFLTDALPSVVPSSGLSHAAAPVLTVDTLSERDRSQLRRYHRVGSCPATLKDYLPGFYELCQRVVEETQLPLSRGRMDSASKKRIAPEPVQERLTADDIAKAKKRPVPTVRVGVTRHKESRFPSSASSQE
ncbi:hypothetical protein A3H22_01185 [Candidatus Peribacteria bacterium RIFCSPLOWO2_12_FULL_55_15]|nr:MAG: hypothetical protein A2789_00855 [Candidatus Peribacteria bacterium RIFCSPHIGHO2_01_FULL_54_22]OGJ62451.1 MAG: hypothetical protein A3D12_01535 [Candidatus Peribacteria bacterium RIFCSPHIGHO2_02_FULL_55_24]OGJ64862.1 MAG: hypothetical protein A3E47_00815 [Candidatus Peribacteria bacterium RIFCSPHIGHO2_12_FULL_54_10]OGJ68762.1 MAG: hypothetical protein A2947_02835 [Candidatus Peribacteria bacterium RIFCSPLOWO2_01_FULL_54_110]OGJ69989.1 MAG: hypothetical protein A3H90_03025 [Candidatus Pe